MSDFSQTNNVVPKELWQSADTGISSLETKLSETGGSPFTVTSAEVKRLVFVWSLWSLLPPPRLKGTSIVAQRDILNSHYVIQPYTGISIAKIHIITIKMNILV